MNMRLVQPEYTVATSDGIRNGTDEMRYSLIGREVTQDSVCQHLSASGLEGTIAVVACDKPPVGTLAALLEHNRGYALKVLPEFLQEVYHKQPQQWYPPIH